MKSGIELISEERNRQIQEEGWTPTHDDSHTRSELSHAAAYYALDPRKRTHFPEYEKDLWPWNKSWLKTSCKYDPNDNPLDRIRELQKAGALIAAEIDRLQRLV